jgi:hypothetical protein
MKIEIIIGDEGETQFKNFIAHIHGSHIDADSLFPGYEFHVSHYPPVDEWTLVVRCGSSMIEIYDADILVSN